MKMIDTDHFARFAHSAYTNTLSITLSSRWHRSDLLCDRLFFSLAQTWLGSLPLTVN